MCYLKLMSERTLSSETLQKVGKRVILFGWVNSRRDHGGVVFLDLRDRTGLIQIVSEPELAEGIKDECVLRVEGEVRKRPEEMVNPNLETGKVEVRAERVEILARAKTPPFDIHGAGYEVNEALRLKYRYLDLRRPRLTQNLRRRAKVVKFIRDFLTEKDFLEIETPILSKSTPEGARDFLVPSRLQPGKFYALPQSPQQYKQLLMVAGFERYFQIVRCFRDEDPRADRAYGGFTQLDLEMSFTSQEEILELTEELFTNLAKKIMPERHITEVPFPRLPHEQVVQEYHTDKPDLRKNKEDKDELAFCFVVDWPLFEKTEEKKFSPMHHPFTAPKDEDIHFLDTDPMKAHSWQHDLVLNGLEVGGGSIRITDPEIQKKIFEILGHSEEETQKKFGHLLEAFEYGVPPHGGIALGIDRFLMAAWREKSIREVMAFPATSGGRTAVMEAPGEVDEKQLRELGIKVS